MRVCSALAAEGTRPQQPAGKLPSNTAEINLSALTAPEQANPSKKKKFPQANSCFFGMRQGAPRSAGPSSRRRSARPGGRFCGARARSSLRLRAKHGENLPALPLGSQPPLLLQTSRSKEKGRSWERGLLPEEGWQGQGQLQRGRKQDLQPSAAAFRTRIAPPARPTELKCFLERAATRALFTPGSSE